MLSYVAELATKTRSAPRLITAWAEYALTIAARMLRAETRGDISSDD